MKNLPTGSEQMIELLTECGLDQTSAERAVQPIALLLDRLVDHTWTLADEQQLTARSDNIRHIINQSTVGRDGDEIIWVSLAKTIRLAKPKWLTEAEFSDVRDLYADQLFHLLDKQISVPFGLLVCQTDVTSIKEPLLSEIDSCWADLTDFLPQHITACMELQFEAVADYGVPETLIDIFCSAMFQPLQRYLTARYIGDHQAADALLPLLELLDEGVLPLGLATPTQPQRVTWLVAIA